MLSTVADLTSLAQLAPWLAVGVVCLIAAAWVYRQARRMVTRAEERAQLSAQRQGERLGTLERKVELLALRRRQVEWELLDLGVDLPLWPPDGPDQPRPRRRSFEPYSEPGPWAEDGVPLPGDDEALTEARRIPVPPLPPDLGARHRRSATA